MGLLFKSLTPNRSTWEKHIITNENSQKMLQNIVFFDKEAQYNSPRFIAILSISLVVLHCYECCNCSIGCLHAGSCYRSLYAVSALLSATCWCWLLPFNVLLAFSSLPPCHYLHLYAFLNVKFSHSLVSKQIYPLCHLAQCLSKTWVASSSIDDLSAKDIFKKDTFEKSTNRDFEQFSNDDDDDNDEGIIQSDILLLPLQRSAK